MTEIELKKCEKLVEFFNTPILRTEQIAGGGSGRKYFRIYTDMGSLIFCSSSDIQENITFIRLTEYLRLRGLRVPLVIDKYKDNTCYLMQDLGNKDLLALIRERRSWDDLSEAMDRIFFMLVHMQCLPHEEWENIVQFPKFNKDLILADFQYAFENFISVCKIEFNEKKLWDEFQFLAMRLLEYPALNWGLMYRDFQSRNIMVSSRKFCPYYFIDYQSARYGPGIYDLVSFAWQAKAGFTPRERDRLINLYINKMKTKGKDIEKPVRKNIDYFVVLRILQTLGAYGKRGLQEGKTHFIESIPAALKNLNEVLAKEKIKNQMPELSSVIFKISEKYNV